LPEERTQELLAGAKPPLDAREHRDQTQLDRDPNQRASVIFGRTRLGCMYYGIDDQLPHPGYARRKKAGDQAQDSENDRQTVVRRPDQGDAVLQLTKHTEQLRPVEARAWSHRPSLGRSPSRAMATRDHRQAAWALTHAFVDAAY